MEGLQEEDVANLACMKFFSGNNLHFVKKEIIKKDSLKIVLFLIHVSIIKKNGKLMKKNKFKKDSRMPTQEIANRKDNLLHRKNIQPVKFTKKVIKLKILST